jgi:hypothetical protein
MSKPTYDELFGDAAKFIALHQAKSRQQIVALMQVHFRIGFQRADNLYMAVGHKRSEVVSAPEPSDAECGWWCDYCDKFDTPIYERGKERCPNCNSSMRYGPIGKLKVPSVDGGARPDPVAWLISIRVTGKGKREEFACIDYSAPEGVEVISRQPLYLGATDGGARDKCTCDKERDQFGDLYEPCAFCQANYRDGGARDAEGPGARGQMNTETAAEKFLLSKVKSGAFRGNLNIGGSYSFSWKQVRELLAEFAVDRRKR